MKHFILAPIFSICATMAVSQENLGSVITPDIIAEINDSGLVVGSSAQFVNAVPCIDDVLLYDAEFKRSGDAFYNRDWIDMKAILDKYDEDTVIVFGHRGDEVVQVVVKVNSSIFSYGLYTSQNIALNARQFNGFAQLSGDYQLSSSRQNYFESTEGGYSLGEAVPHTNLCL